MPDSSKVLPPTTPSVTQNRELQGDVGYSPTQRIADAYRTTSPIQIAIDLYRRSGTAYDDSFVLTPEKVKAYGEGLPTETLGAFSDATSDADAMAIRRNLLRYTESERRLATIGYQGDVLKFATSILDPVNIATSVVTGGLGASAKAGRLAFAARAGIANVAASVPAEALAQWQHPDRSTADVLIAAASSFALGGGVGALEWGLIRRAAVHADLKETPGVTLVPKGEAEAAQLAEIADTTLATIHDHAIVDGALPAPEPAARPEYFTVARRGRFRQDVDGAITPAPKPVNGEGFAIKGRGISVLPTDNLLTRDEMLRSLVPTSELPASPAVTKREPTVFSVKGRGRYTQTDAGVTTTTTGMSIKGRGQFSISDSPRPAAGAVEYPVTPAPAADVLANEAADAAKRAMDERAFVSDLVSSLAASRSVAEVAASRGTTEAQVLAAKVADAQVAAVESLRTTPLPADAPIPTSGQVLNVLERNRALDDEMAALRRDTTLSDKDYAAKLADINGRRGLIAEDLGASLTNAELRTKLEPVDTTLRNELASIEQQRLQRNADAGLGPNAPKPYPDLDAAEAAAIQTAASRAGMPTSQPTKGLGTASATDPAFRPVGATPPPDLGPLDFDLSQLVGKSVPMPTFEKGRIDLFGRTLGLDQRSPLVRRFLIATVEDPLPRTEPGGEHLASPTVQSASEWRRATGESIVAQFQKRFDQAFAATNPSLNPIERAAQRAALNREAAIAARMKPGAYTTDVAVNVAADAWRILAHEAADFAKRYGVPGFESFDLSVGDYFTRLGSKSAINQAIADYGLEAVESVVAKAIRLGNYKGAVPATDEEIMVYARAWLKMQMGEGELTPLGRTMALAGDNATKLQMAVKDVLKGGEPPRARERIPMDELVSIDPPARYNPDAPATLRFVDLLDSNVESMARKYTNDTLGAAATRKVLAAMRDAEDEAIPSPAEVLAKLDGDMIDSGVPIAQRARTLELAEGLLRHTMGMPLHSSTSRGVQAARLLSTLGTTVRAGSFVIANATDLGGVLSETSWRSLLAGVPDLANSVKLAATGRTDGELATFIADVLGVGNDNWVHRVVGRMDFSGPTAENVIGGFDQGLRHIARWQSKWSGLEAANVLLKQYQAAALLHEWSKAAETGALPSTKRLAAMGLTPEDGRAILAEFAANKRTSPGGRLIDVDIDSWKPDVAAKFIVAIRKTASRAVQTNDIGSLPAFATTPVGRMLTQFRSFTLVSSTKQTAFNLAMGDKRTAWFALTSLFAGALGYYGSVLNSAAGRPDREKYLKERLSPENVALGALGRTSWFSVFAPPIEFVSQGAGGGSLFSAGRTSGLDSSPIFGNPTFQAAASASRLPGAARALFDPGYRFSRSHFAAVRAFTPLQNFPLIRQSLDAIQGELPRQSQHR